MVLDTMLDKVIGKFLDAWQAAAKLRTYAQAAAEALAFRSAEGASLDLTPEQWLEHSKRLSWYEAREMAEALGIEVEWDAERAKTPEGYYQVQGGLGVRHRQVARRCALRRHSLDGNRDRRPARSQGIR